MSVIPLRVAVRARPLIQKENNEGCQVCLNFIPLEPQILLGKDKTFTFDFVFRPNDPQAQVYEEAVKPLVEHIFRGYNSTVLAYGQTGSGKTFTMGGGYEDSLKMDPEKMGIIPRIVQEIFNTINDRENCTFKVAVSYLEIINEELQDLLEKKESLVIREENGVIKLPGLKEQSVDSVMEIMALLEQGCSNRTTAATAMNQTSSRSHAIFSLYIEQHNKEDSNDFWKVKLQLVDLAGSERIKKTHAEGERLKEGININKGLLCLGNVISVLGDESNSNRKPHVPYRDSKLTRILQDSLGGNSYTVMIACVSPADSNMEETLNTLRYADRARKIKNKPVVNWDPQTAEIMKLKSTVQQLTMKLIHAGIGDMPDEEVEKIDINAQNKNRELQETLQKYMEKCAKLEEEIETLSKEFQNTLDQAVTASERAVRMELKCERLRERLKELEQSIGVDFDLLSSSLVEPNPALAEQLAKLKTFANKLHESMHSEDVVTTDQEDDDDDDKDEEMDVKPDVDQPDGLDTPESKEYVKLQTLRRAKQNSELQELNKMLEKKERIANQITMNDTKMAEIVEEYKGNMKQLEEKISGLESEKSELNVALEDARTHSAASKVSEQRRQRMMELETRMSDLRKQLAEQKKLLKLKEQKEKEATKMNTEILALKQARVKLMKQMKEDSDSWRKFRQQKDKEVLQLQQKDRKRQFEIQNLQRENQRTQTILHRKSEEAAAANRRLKEAMAKQKKVLEERNQKFEKCDNTTIGNRVRKWLSHEMDVKVGIMEAKYHRESQFQDRKLLVEQLLQLKESLGDGPPSKKLGLLDDSGVKQEVSLEEEAVRIKIQHLEQQIEIRNVQISDLQQKIFDAEQEGKGKSTKANLHTMMEAKIAIKWLMDQAVSFKADNARVRVDLEEARECQQEDSADNRKYMEELEEKIELMKRRHANDLLKLRTKQDKQIEVLLAKSKQAEDARKEVDKKLTKQTAEIDQLREQLKNVPAGSCPDCIHLEKQMTKVMYTDKKIALMPVLNLDADENGDGHNAIANESSSPFKFPREKPTLKVDKGHVKHTMGERSTLVSPKLKTANIFPTPELSKNVIPESEEEIEAESEAEEEMDTSVEEIDDKNKDPDFRATPLMKDAKNLQLKGKRRKTALFVQNDDKCSADSSLEKSQSEKGCGCSTNCKNRRCVCKKNEQFCSDLCKCTSCENMEIQLPESTMSEEPYANTSLNTTFDVEPSGSDTSIENREVSPVEKPVKIMGKPPKIGRQASRSVLGNIQGVQDVSSSDEFEKPRLMRKSVSAGMLRKKTSNSDLRQAENKGMMRKTTSKSELRQEGGQGDEMQSLVEGFNKKKRKLNSTKGFFFSGPSE
ncbi:chromosome-associated kinesin KIF4-like [Mya arenaria]|uniref:chromosome-associated kinesin KIF4-like n=1 Tax=Mya arenaria TaxID=6604 RepID=UPI0022E484D8|nr:chromosome-associated kinesin KIF4-like [Mya arenaria]XP_052792483.1 chromosome-associated kinesin KIF4-like [Mya arenaria]